MYINLLISRDLSGLVTLPSCVLSRASSLAQLAMLPSSWQLFPKLEPPKYDELATKHRDRMPVARRKNTIASFFLGRTEKAKRNLALLRNDSKKERKKESRSQKPKPPARASSVQRVMYTGTVAEESKRKSGKQVVTKGGESEERVKQLRTGRVRIMSTIMEVDEEAAKDRKSEHGSSHVRARLTLKRGKQRESESPCHKDDGYTVLTNRSPRMLTPQSL